MMPTTANTPFERGLFCRKDWDTPAAGVAAAEDEAAIVAVTVVPPTLVIDRATLVGVGVGVDTGVEEVLVVKGVEDEVVVEDEDEELEDEELVLELDLP